MEHQGKMSFGSFHLTWEHGTDQTGGMSEGEVANPGSVLGSDLESEAVREGGT